jgi:long-chain acyl-CoA synthetase
MAVVEFSKVPLAKTKRGVPVNRKEKHSSGSALLRDSLGPYVRKGAELELTPTATLPRIFSRIAAIHGARTLLLEKREGAYCALSSQEVSAKAQAFAAALVDLGLPLRGRVAFFLRNSPAWVIADFGTMFAGGITVPLYPTQSSAAIAYILQNSEASAIVVEDADQYRQIQEIQGELPLLAHIVVRKPEGVPLGVRVHAFDALLQRGERRLLSYHRELARRLHAVARDDVASIVYTSGTTAKPKGVMLTHGNILSNVCGLLWLGGMDERDLLLSLLPLSHVFERTVGYYYPLLSGARIAYAEGIKQFAQNLREVRPTICLVVPRVLEKFHQRVLEAMEAASPLQRKIFHWALEVGGKRVEKLQEIHRHFGEHLPDEHHRPLEAAAAMPRVSLGLGLKLRQALAERLVYQKIQEHLGGRMRFFVSGGAPLARHVADFFYELAIPVFEGYGMTETSPIVSCNFVYAWKLGTVGKLLPQVQVKISQEGEILVKGPSVTSGYFQDPTSTAEAIDGAGWLHTGDMGRFDDDGFLTITGRTKELIVLSTGKKVALPPLESKLKASSLVSQAVVIGDDRPYVSALIFPNTAELQSWAKTKGLAEANLSTLCESGEVHQFFAALVETTNVDFSHHEQIKRFEIVPHDIERDPELMTPTLKVRRNIVAGRFAEIIDKMYR